MPTQTIMPFTEWLKTNKYPADLDPMLRQRAYQGYMTYKAKAQIPPAPPTPKPRPKPRLTPTQRILVADAGVPPSPKPIAPKDSGPPKVVLGPKVKPLPPPPTPSPELVPFAMQYKQDLQTLSEYRQDGGYNLAAIYQANDTKAVEVAERLFKASDLQVARRLALPVIEYKKWKKLSEEKQREFRFLAPKPLHEYQQLSDFAKTFYYPETKVTQREWEMLGPSGRKYAKLEPTLAEKIEDLPGNLRHYVAEGLGKGHEWLAEHTIPGIGRQLALGGYDLLGIPIQLCAVSFDVGAQLGRAKPEEAGRVITETAKGMGQFFAAIPAAVAKDPTALAYYTIMLGPMAVGAGKTAVVLGKKVGTAAHPYGIPTRGIAIEGSIASVKLGEAGYQPSLTIMAEALRQQVTSTRTRLLRQSMVEEAKVQVEPGYMTRRVAGVVTDKGRILLVIDRTETAGVFSLVGGKIDPVWGRGQLGWRRNPQTGKMELSPQGAFHGQVKSETGIGIRDTTFLPSYSGFTTMHSLPGTYIFLAKALKSKFNLGKGELQSALWWDGRTKITVYPSTYYILRDLARQGVLDINMSKVKMFKGDPKAKWQMEAKHQDPGYGEKVKSWNEGTYGDKYKLKGDVWKGERIIRVPKVKQPIVTELTLKHRLTPAQTEFYDVVYHGTPNATAMLRKLQTKGYLTIKGKLFTSPQAAMRFVAQGARGEAPANPAVFAIRVPKRLVPKLADFPYKQWKGGIEAEIVFKGGVRLSTTPVNTFARFHGKSGIRIDQSIEGGVFRQRLVDKGKAVTGETFTQYPGATFIAKQTRINKRVYKLEQPVGIEKGQFIPMYWLKAPGARARVPEVARMYAVTLKALKETIYDIAVTTGDIAKDIARLRRPEALKKIRLEYNLGEGFVPPMTSPLRFTTRAYGQIKIIQRVLEAEAAKLMRYAEREAKGRKPQLTRDYIEALEKATREEVGKILKNPKVSKLLREERARFKDTFTINLAKYTTALHLGEQHADRVVRLREDVDIRSTYRYNPQSGRVTVESRTGVTPAGREELARQKGRGRIPVEGRRPPTEERPPAKRPPTEERSPTEERVPREERPLDEEGKIKYGGGFGRRQPRIEIERVEGIPEDPGIITYNDGIVKVIMKPPYREGTDDIDFERLEKPQRGKGSQEDTLRVQKGKKAPRRLDLSRGVVRTTILGGKKMQHSRQYPQRGPGIITRSGKVIKQKRGSII